MLSFILKSFGISFFAGLCAWAFLSLWSGPVLFWAAIIAWASFYQTGADSRALITTIFGSLIGALCGWSALLIIQSIPWPAAPGMPSWYALVLFEDTNKPFLIDINLTSLWAGGAVLVTVLFMTLLSRIKALCLFPVGAYGYACVFAVGFADPSRQMLKSLFVISLDNALVAVLVSMFFGALSGFVLKRYKF